MKAAIYTEYGSPDVLKLKDVAKPVPGEKEILVRVRASAVNFGDLIARNFGRVTPGEFNMPSLLYFPSRLAFGWSKPKNHILGSELAGDVEAVGAGVSQFKPGDAVFAYAGMRMGANAEYIRLAADGALALKPANLSYAQAATLPYGGVMALNILRKVSVRPGQRVLINGASGAIGSMAVQLARYYGAEVCGVCGAGRLGYVQALGADRVIDYAKEDFTRGGETYDLILDVLGRSTFSRCKKALTPNGVYLAASFKGRALLEMLWTSRFSSQKVICALVSEQPGDLDFIRGLAEAGKIKALVDRSFPLEQTAAAHWYVEKGQKQGPVVITIN